MDERTMVYLDDAIDAIYKEASYANRDVADEYADMFVYAIRTMPSAQPESLEWCTDCKEYDQDAHCCPRWNRVIRETLKDAQPERKKGVWIIDKDCEGKSRTITCNRCGHKEFNWYDPNFCPNCGSEMEGES